MLRRAGNSKFHPWVDSAIFVDMTKKTSARNRGKTDDIIAAATKKEEKARLTPRDSAREMIESVVIAFVLAFLFRTFEAEAFVIPTGSMATTLMGRHLDIDCPECGFRYQVGALRDE